MKILTQISKTTPVDADEIAFNDSAASFVLKKLTWANLKATLKTYFDTLYQAVLVSGTNIKTINGSSILGSGNLTVSGGGMSILAIQNYTGTLSYALSTTLGDVDATNAVLSFTTGATGRTLITVEYWAELTVTFSGDQAWSGAEQSLVLRSGSTEVSSRIAAPIPLQYSIYETNAGATADIIPRGRVRAEFLMSLTASTAYTLKLSAIKNSAGQGYTIKSNNTTLGALTIAAYGN
jgi:hypothetical protein